MRRFSLHLTCFVIGVALCAVPFVDAGEFTDAHVTLSKQKPERPHLALPTPQPHAHSAVPQFFVAPGIDTAPLVTRIDVVLTRAREEAGPGLSWRARAHPAQAPPA